MNHDDEDRAGEQPTEELEPRILFVFDAADGTLGTIQHYNIQPAHLDMIARWCSWNADHARDEVALRAAMERASQQSPAEIQKARLNAPPGAKVTDHGILVPDHGNIRP